MSDERDIHHLGGKLAQVLGETILHIHPHIARLSEQERTAAQEAFLEGLEAHGAKVAGPLMQAIYGGGDIPPELANLFAEVAAPTAQFSGIVQQFFVFGLMFQLGGVMLAPFVQSVQDRIWQAHPDRPLSPPDIATMVVRGLDLGGKGTTPVPQWALDEAGKSGLDPAHVQALVDSTGMPPNLQLLFEMVRRGVITEDELVKGIRQGDTRDEWITYVTKMRYVVPSPTDFVRAAIQAQMSYDDAAAWAQQVGLEPPDYMNHNPDWFKLLYNIAGRPPGPVEMGHAANRNIIPWQGTGPGATTFQQAIAESDIKTKWTPILEKLAQYFPPPGEVRTLLMHGGITKEQAIALWQQGGIPVELATAYAHVAEVEQVTQDKALTKGEIASLVQEQVIDDDTALAMLGQIGYTDGNARYLVDMAHFRYEAEMLRSAVRRVATLYTGHKATAAQARKALAAFGMEPAQIDSLMVTLDDQRVVNAPVITQAEVTAAWEHGNVTQKQAEHLLEDLGYSPWQAWLLLSNKNKGPLPDAPPFPGMVESA